MPSTPQSDEIERDCPECHGRRVFREVHDDAGKSVVPPQYTCDKCGWIIEIERSDAVVGGGS